MGKKYLFSESSSGINKIKVDPKHMDKQIREEKAKGRTVVVMDEKEYIEQGLILKGLKKGR